MWSYNFSQKMSSPACPPIAPLFHTSLLHIPSDCVPSDATTSADDVVPHSHSPRGSPVRMGSDDAYRANPELTSAAATVATPEGGGTVSA